MPDNDPYQLRDLAREVALEAAELVAVRRRSGVSVADTKTSATDVVTEVDRASEELIRTRLLAARPGDGFLGEEGGSATSDSGVTWVVDPIDGTVNFLYGLPPYAVSIAARVGEEDVAGVVVDVAGGDCFSAVRGGGAYLGERRLRVREPVPLDRSLVITGFNYVPRVRELQGRAVARMLPQVRDVRRLGSAALDLCAVAAGRADCYVEEGLHAWDLAAGALVAREAGARVEVLPGVGGSDLVVAAPAPAYLDFEALVRACGFAAG